MTLRSPAGYDAESRLLASSRAGVTTAQRTLDAVGNTISITDANSNTTRTDYDLANRVTQVTAANTDNSKTTYDAVGNVLTKTDGSGRVTTFTYDKRSRKLSETNFAGDKTEYSYDGAGNLVTTKKPIGTWTYSFDAADRLKTVTTPETHVTTYTYDKNNNNLTVKNANLHTLSTMVYNERNRLIAMTYPNGEAESYRYDANDNRVERIDANGKVHTMVFDAWNRLIRQSAPTTIPTQVASSVLSYDGNNNLLSTVETLGDGSQKTELNQYDGRDRLIQTTDRNGRVLKYGYDLASNQTTYTDSDGITSERTFDKKNRLIKTLRATLGAILLTYTAADELKTITHPNGTETNRTFDQAGRLASITVSQGSVTVSQRVYTFDRNGNRLTQVEKNGGAAETSTYEYDLDNRLLKVIGPDQTETYTIDAAGNRKTEVVKNLANVVIANKIYSYNSREQLLSVADGANTTTYLYDRNGNQTSVKIGAAPATIYVWGPRDQLASLSTGEAFEYDSAGHRTAKTSGGNRTLYVWSGDQLMAETNTIGNSLSQVTRVGSLLLGEVRGGVAQHLHQDAFNSVMVTSLADGTIPGRLSYRAFGQVRSLTGNVATPFRFNGYVSDGGDELSSPSRFYSMGTGRFTSMDPVPPTAMDPLSWNAHLGLGANPMFNIDPNGREIWNTEMILLNQRAASRDPNETARINKQLSAYNAQQSIEIQKSAGTAAGLGDVVVHTVVGAAAMAEASIKTHIAHQSNGLIFSDQIRQNEQTSAAIAEFITNRPYDRTVNALSNEFSNIHELDASGDYFNSRRRGANLAANSAFVATGVGGLMKGGVMLGGKAVARASAFVGEVGTASRGAAVFSGESAVMAQIDADFARLTRLAEGEAVVVVEGPTIAAAYSGMRSPLSLKPTTSTALLPDELNTGTYDDLIDAGMTGDNLTPHHMPGATYMEKRFGIPRGDSHAMNVEQPKTGGRHRRTESYGRSAFVDEAPRDALARDVQDLRRILRQDGLYNVSARKQFLNFTRDYTKAYPIIFNKKPPLL